MSFFSFIKSDPLSFVLMLLASLVIVYSAFQFFKEEKSGLSTLLATTIIVVFYFYSQAYSGSLREAKTTTVVVMPNKNNLRLGEDGKLSFCIDGMARNWSSTQNGIISTKERRYMGRPMRCLSIEASLRFLAENGATEAQLKAFSSVYK